MQVGDKVTYVPFVLQYAKDTELRAPSVTVPVVWCIRKAALRWWSAARGDMRTGSASGAKTRKSKVRYGNANNSDYEP